MLQGIQKLPPLLVPMCWLYCEFVAFFAPKPCRKAVTNFELRLISSWTAFFVRSAKIFSKTPFYCRRQKYLYTLFQFPNSGGKARHELPFLNTHLIPLKVRRKSRQGRPNFFFGNIDSGLPHSSSVNSIHTPFYFTQKISYHTLSTVPSIAQLLLPYLLLAFSKLYFH